MMRLMIIALGILTVAATGCSKDEGSGAGGFAEHSTGGTDVLRDEDGRVLAVRGRFKTPGGGSAETRAKAFVGSFRAALGLAEGVELGKASVTGTKIQTVSFRLTAGGHPIESARLAIRLTPEEVFFVLVSAPPSVPDLLKPTLDGAAAKAKATKILSGVAVDGEPELVVYAPALLMRGTNTPRLAWRVSMEPTFEGGLSALDLFIDAVDGSEIGRRDHVRRARQRKIYDAKACIFPSDWFACTVQIYGETGLIQGAPYSQEAEHAWTFAGNGCDFLQSSFSDVETCSPLQVYVNSKDDEAAQLAGDLYFGPGHLPNDAEAYRTFMHELGHALLRKKVPDQTNYYGEPGAVDEAFADVVSMLATKPAEWVVDPGHKYERNISDPVKAKDNPTHYNDLRDRTHPEGDQDEGWVHFNSVILSHAIWLATVKGLTVRMVSVEGMGEESMTSILDELMRGYLGAPLSLKQTAAALIDACMVHPLWRDLLKLEAANISFRDCGLLVNALADVGLSKPDQDLDGWPDREQGGKDGEGDNCNTKYNPYQEDADGDNVGDACDPDAKPPDPSTDPGFFPCPNEFVSTSAGGTWPLSEHWGHEPDCCPLVPVYDYHCRYGPKPAHVITGGYSEYVGFGLRWATEPRDTLGCGNPPANPGEDIVSDTHSAEVSHGSTSNPTFRNEQGAFATKLLGVLTQGMDASDNKVLPAAAAPCQ